MDSELMYTRRIAPGTGNLLVHHSVFDKIGVFDESLQSAGEDTDLFRRMRRANIEAWYTPTAIVRHVIPTYRLQPSYFEWVSLRIGGHVARRERQDWGACLFPLVLAARVAQSALQIAPRLALAGLFPSRRRWLGAQCRKWLAVGYLRHGLSLLAPRLFAQESFFASLQFRAERQTLAGK